MEMNALDAAVAAYYSAGARLRQTVHDRDDLQRRLDDTNQEVERLLEEMKAIRVKLFATVRDADE